MKKTAIVYFGNSLAPGDFRNEDTRRDQLKQGVELLAEFPSLRILRELPSVCAVSIEGDDLEFQRLEQVLDERSLGRITVTESDERVFRAARD